MTGRDPRGPALRQVVTARATVIKCDEAAEKARAAYRRALVAAKRAGVTVAEASRTLDTSESRIRQEILRGTVEQS